MGFDERSVNVVFRDDLHRAFPRIVEQPGCIVGGAARASYYMFLVGVFTAQRAVRKCYPCARTSGWIASLLERWPGLLRTVGTSLYSRRWKATMDTRLPSLLVQSLHRRKAEQAEGDA